jgi:hypothetical protein
LVILAKNSSLRYKNASNSHQLNSPTKNPFLSFCFWSR